MNTLIPPLEGKDFRKRIDGMNFTLVKPHTYLKDIKDEGLLEKEKQHVMLDALSSLAKVFEFNMDRILLVKASTSIDLTKRMGVFIEVYFRKVDLFVVIQLKGYFFIHEDSFSIARGLILKVSDELKDVFRVTLIDVAQDFLVPVAQVLPDPAKCPKDTRYCFKHTCRNNFSREGELSIYTGFEIFAGRFKLIVYDKAHENQNNKNPLKKAYYENLFNSYPGMPVTRVELRLKQDGCKTLVEPFYNHCLGEEDFISLCLFSLYRKHKLRIRRPGSKDNDWRRWDIHPNWEYLFSKCSDLSLLGSTQADFLFTTPHEGINEAISKFVEAIAMSCPNYTREEFLSALESLDIDNYRLKAQQKIARREKTKIFLESFKKSVLTEQGQTLGMSITSPTKRNENIITNS